jgi:Cof subfamily protein (haloacid dehalogenase superfamily)
VESGLELDGVTLVASDLDGTLLGPEATVTERTVRTLRALADRGIEIVAVTGRSHWSSVAILRPVGCIRWVICSNGATVYDFEAESVVHRRPLGRDQVTEVIGRLEGAFPEVGLAWEAVDGIFHSEQWLRNRRAIDPGFTPEHSQLVAQGLDVDQVQVLKLMAAHDRLVTYEWLEAVGPHLPAGVSGSTSGATFVEVTRADANKGSALEHLCAELAVDRSQTMAFGDHANDLSMLDWAGVSFAMANADARVLAAADHPAPHHADDGVARVLERLL